MAVGSAIGQMRVTWAGFPGGPGVSTFYFGHSGVGAVTSTDATNAALNLQAFFNAIKATIPTSINVSWDGIAELVYDGDGELAGSLTYTIPGSITGTGAAAYSGASGAAATWLTATIRNGRVLRGRTFIVPMSTVVYDTDGTITSTQLTTLRAAATALVASQAGANPWGFLVWGRPRGVGASDGTAALVTSSAIKDKVAILSSRRD